MIQKKTVLEVTDPGTTIYISVRFWKTVPCQWCSEIAYLRRRLILIEYNNNNYY